MRCCALPPSGREEPQARPCACCAAPSRLASLSSHPQASCACPSCELSLLCATASLPPSVGALVSTALPHAQLAGPQPAPVEAGGAAVLAPLPRCPLCHAFFSSLPHLPCCTSSAYHTREEQLSSNYPLPPKHLRRLSCTRCVSLSPPLVFSLRLRAARPQAWPPATAMSLSCSPACLAQPSCACPLAAPVANCSPVTVPALPLPAVEHPLQRRRACGHCRNGGRALV